MGTTGPPASATVALAGHLEAVSGARMAATVATLAAEQFTGRRMALHDARRGTGWLAGSTSTTGSSEIGDRR